MRFTIQPYLDWLTSQPVPWLWVALGAISGIALLSVIIGLMEEWE